MAATLPRIAALPLYWFVCRRLAPGREKLAFALGAVSSLWIHGAQTGRCYALMLLLACAQVLLALRLRGDQEALSILVNSRGAASMGSEAANVTTARSARRATARATCASAALRVPAGRMNSCKRGRSRL